MSIISFPLCVFAPTLKQAHAAILYVVVKVQSQALDLTSPSTLLEAGSLVY